MTWELNRRRFVRTINGKFIYGRIVSIRLLVLLRWSTGRKSGRSVSPRSQFLAPAGHRQRNQTRLYFATNTDASQPLLHTIIFFIEMALVARLTARFNSYYDERPRTLLPLDPLRPPFEIAQY
jgi:hypothetical protein